MIKIDHMIKDYDNFHLDISLDIPEGRVTGIVGRNGAGKSTTIKSILGLVHPNHGSVKIFGKDACDLTAEDKQQLGVAFSDSGFSLLLTAKDIIRILRKMYRNFDEDFFLRKLTEQGIPLDKKLKDYSTGMKAKLRVLVAISHKADLLILDEPTAGLDVIARKDVLDMLREYMAADDRRSLVITSHISTDLEELCDDIYMIHDGKVIIHEDTDVLLDRYGLLKVSDSDYQTLDKSYLLKTRKIDFGYICYTNELQYYRENYAGIVIEKGSIDEMILMMADNK